MASFFWFRAISDPLFDPPFWGKTRFGQKAGNESQGFWDLKFGQNWGPKSDITFLAKKRDFWRFHSTIIFTNTLFDTCFDRSFSWNPGQNRVVEWNRQNRDFPDFGDFWEKWVNYFIVFLHIKSWLNEAGEKSMNSVINMVKKGQINDLFWVQKVHK